MLAAGLVSISFRGKTPDEILALCVQGGLNSVEWGENAHVFAGDIQGAKLLGEKTRDLGLRIACYGSYYRMEPQDHPPADFEPSLQSAAALGAPIIRVWAGRKGSAITDCDARKRIVENAQIIAEHAKPYGIQIAMEWHLNTLSDTTESGLRFMDEVQHENFYSQWQPTPEIPFERRNDAILALGDRLTHIHCFAWDDARVRLELSDGLDCWNHYFSALNPKRDYDVLLEFVKGDTNEQFFKDVKTLLALTGQYNERNGG